MKYCDAMAGDAKSVVPDKIFRSTTRNSGARAAMIARKT
jgi:hypothetical protein